MKTKYNNIKLTKQFCLIMFLFAFWYSLNPPLIFRIEEALYNDKSNYYIHAGHVMDCL